MRTLFLMSALAVLFTSGICLAHGLNQTTTAGQSTVITIAHDDGTAFSFETYEVHSPASKIPFQIGHTDRLGRVIFAPNVSGTWRVRVWSEDGHGTSVDVPITDTNLPASQTAKPMGRGSKMIIGLSVLFGCFGVLSLITNRQKT